MPATSGASSSTRPVMATTPALFDAVNTALESGETPDLVAALPEQTLAWDASGCSRGPVPLISATRPGAWRSRGRRRFPAVFWAQDNLEGKQLGLPAQRSARFLFYNQTWAHELGFNSPPATADEFRQQACAANAFFRIDADPQNDGYGGWIVDTDWQTTYSWLLAFGGGVVDGNGLRLPHRPEPGCPAIPEKPVRRQLCLALHRANSHSIRSPAVRPSSSAATWPKLPVANESMSRLKNADEWTVIPFPGSHGQRRGGLWAFLQRAEIHTGKTTGCLVVRPLAALAGKPVPVGGGHRAVPAAQFRSGHDPALPPGFPAMGGGRRGPVPGAGGAATGLLAQGPLRAGGWG